MDNASKQTTEPKETSWKPLKAAARGVAYGAIAAIILDALCVGWALNKNRQPFGGWQKGTEAMIGFTAVMLLWGAVVGLFCAKLPNRVGKGLRFLWALAGCAVAFLVPYVAITVMDTSRNSQEGARIMGVIGACMGLMFALIGQFAQEPPAKAGR